MEKQNYQNLALDSLLFCRFPIFSVFHFFKSGGREKKNQTGRNEQVWPISQLLLQSQCLSRMGTGNDSTATAEEATIINVLMICYICQCFNSQSMHACSKWMKSQAAFSGRLLRDCFPPDSGSRINLLTL